MKKTETLSCLISFVLITVTTFLAYSYSFAVEFVDNLAVIDIIPIEERPLYMALTPDGSRLYVVQTPPQSVNAQGNVFVVDTETNEIVDTISLDIGYPFQIAMTPDGSTAYLAVSKASGSTVSNGPNRIEVIDVSTNTIVSTIPIGGSEYGPQGVDITPDGSRVYVTHRGSNRVEVIDATTDTVIKSIVVGTQPVGLDITPDGSRVYVANRLSSTVSVIDTTTNTIITTISVGIGPCGGSTSVSITPDGSRAYVTYSYDHRIAIIDTDPNSSTYNQQVNVIETTGSDLREITILPDDTLAFVNSNDTNEMLIIETDPSSSLFNIEVGTIPVGASPFGLVYQALPVAVAYVSTLEGVVAIAATMNMDLPTGWSMISLPVDPTDKRLKALFPGAVVVYGYEKGTGYVRVGNDDDLAVGKGYWILLNQNTSYTLTGDLIPSYAHTASSDGWAMIGGCTHPAQVIPHSCDIGVIYGYAQGTGYKRVPASEPLQRGKGYWILIKNATEATISVETVD